MEDSNQKDQFQMNTSTETQKEPAQFPPEPDREKSTHSMKRWQGISMILVAYDIIAVNAAYFLALWFRFDCQFSKISSLYLQGWLWFAPIYTVFCLILFTRMRLYNSVWRFASYTELIRVVIASVIAAIVHTAGITLWLLRMPMTYYVFGALLQFVLIKIGRAHV